MDVQVNKTPKLLDVLENPHLLSAFAEFMDSQKRLSLVQFWMTSHNILQQVSFIKSTSDGWVEEPEPFLMEDTKNVFYSFFLSESPLVVHLEESLINQVKSCYKELNSKELNQIHDLKWAHILEKTRDWIYNQMDSIDFPLFMNSPAFVKLSASWSAENGADLDLPMNNTNDFRISGETDRSRQSLEGGEEERSSRKPFKNVFRKFRKSSHDALGSSRKSSEEIPRSSIDALDTAKTPSRKDATDNLEGELKSLLHVEDGIFGVFKKRSSSRTREHSKNVEISDSSDHSSHSGGLFKNFKSKKILKTKKNNPISQIVKSPLEESASSEGLGSRDFQVSVDSLVQPLSDSLESLESQNREFIAKTKYKDLEQEYESIQRQIQSLSLQDQDSNLSRQLNLMKIGLQVELNKLESEMKSQGFGHFFSPVYLL